MSLENQSNEFQSITSRAFSGSIGLIIASATGKSLTGSTSSLGKFGIFLGAMALVGTIIALPVLGVIDFFHKIVHSISNAVSASKINEPKSLSDEVNEASAGHAAHTAPNDKLFNELGARRRYIPSHFTNGKESNNNASKASSRAYIPVRFS
jgi:hypothetical protein